MNIKKSIVFLFVMMTAGYSYGQLPKLQSPFRIEANGEPIELIIGHAAPYMIDYNGDGRKDLVVGEFGEKVSDVDKKKMERMSDEEKQSYVVSLPDAGRARVYLNVGTDKKPKFGNFTYLQAGGHDAAIPSSCCIGFDPFFIDLNGDGYIDVTSGQYTGGYINFYEGIGEKSLKFKEGKKLMQEELMGDNEDVEKELEKNMSWWMRTANFEDYDGDGDYDMVWGNVHAEVYYAENIGSPTAYNFAKSVPMTVSDKPIVVNGKSDPFPVDWDNDGILDLLVATEASDVLFFKGKSKGSTDFEPGISLWTGRRINAGDKPAYRDVVKSMEAMGENRPYPGYRTRLGVTDWNNDGKLDLIVGNTYSGEKTFGNVYVFLRQ